MKSLPFDLATIRNIVKKYPTPFYLYDEVGIRATAQKLNEAFAWAPGFTNFYAVKVLANPVIMDILKQEGMGVDCSSVAELVLADKTGFKGSEIMFSSNDTAAAEFAKASELGAVINLDDISHIAFLESTIGKLPELLCFRFNPGAERTGNAIIGNPVEAKYGLTREQLFEAYKTCQTKGVQRFGLHTMVVSNELEPSYFIETAKMMFELTAELKERLGIELEFINLGGGFGIPYSPEQEELDVAKISNHMKQMYDSILSSKGLRPKLFFEHGRYVTGPHGYLVSTVLHLKHIYREFVGLDASMANLMRPGVYGAYHHITILGKEDDAPTHVYDVTGSLCENNDKFAIQRSLPRVEIGDIMVLRDAGAHGHSMGFNYNGKLRSAELLLRQDKSVRLIRRSETLDDYFATLNY